ncbi:MAG: helix-turn-helix transcriptional regulator [Myxococcota bacterium]
MPDFIDDILAALRKRGMTQAELAERAGMTAGNLSRLLRRKHPPNLNTLDRLADALGHRVRLVDSD